MIEIKEETVYAVLVGLITPEQSEERTKEYLDELAFLADTNHIVPVKRFVQRLEQPNTSTYVGEGKLQEIREYIQNSKISPNPSFKGGEFRAAVPSSSEGGTGGGLEGGEVSIVIFDDELSPRQLRNIERELNTLSNGKQGHVRVMDRTILILEIFLQRAQTSYAKTQVEMAHLQYMLPRLTRMWSHLDRQRGGGSSVSVSPYCART